MLPRLRGSSQTPRPSSQSMTTSSPTTLGWTSLTMTRHPSDPCYNNPHSSSSGHLDSDPEECADQGQGPLHVPSQLHSGQEPGLCPRVYIYLTSWIISSPRLLISRSLFPLGLWMMSPALTSRCRREDLSNFSARPRDSLRKSHPAIKSLFLIKSLFNKIASWNKYALWPKLFYVRFYLFLPFVSKSGYDCFLLE